MNTDAIILNVDAQDLINTAELFSESGTRVATITDEMMSLVTGLTGVWTGDASAAYINKFAALDDDIMRMINMINEHVADLEEMAQNYLENENDGVVTAELVLSDEVII